MKEVKKSTEEGGEESPGETGPLNLILPEENFPHNLHYT